MKGLCLLVALARSFSRDARGAAAVEFAIILPTMLILFFGTFEVSMLLRAYLTANRAAQVIADLVALKNSQLAAGTAPVPLAPSDINDYCLAAKMAMAPFPGGPITAGPLKATIVSVTKNSSGSVVFDWSQQDTSCGGGAGTFTSASGAANGLVPNNGDTVIVVKIQYAYTATLHFVLPATFTISQVAYQRPRINSAIPHS